MSDRSVEDRLREEYFNLLPDIRRVTAYLDAEVRYHILPIAIGLDKYERVIVTSRIKECESAINALRRRCEGRTFDRDRPHLYTLADLKDLAGVRVLAFPQKRLREVNARLAELFADWTPDPVRIEGESAELAFKYQGFCHEASANVKVEVQIVPALIGAFWEVEHAAIYKPTLELKGVDRDEEMKECIRDVYQALRAFEGEFEEVVARALAKT